MSHETKISKTAERPLDDYAQSALAYVDAIFLRELAREIAVNGERAKEPRYLRGYSMIYNIKNNSKATEPTNQASGRYAVLGDLDQSMGYDIDGDQNNPDNRAAIFVNISADTKKQNDSMVARRYRIRMRYRGPGSLSETFILEELNDGTKRLMTEFIVTSGRRKYSLKEETADIHVAPLVEQCLMNFEPEFG